MPDLLLDLDTVGADALNTNFKTTFTEGGAAVGIADKAAISDDKVGNSDNANAIKSVAISFQVGGPDGYLYDTAADILQFSGTPATMVGTWNAEAATLPFTQKSGSTAPAADFAS